MKPSIHVPQWRPWAPNQIYPCPPYGEPRYLTEGGVVYDKLPPAASKVVAYCLLGPWVPVDREHLNAAPAFLSIHLVEVKAGEELTRMDWGALLSERRAGALWRFACPPAPSLKANPLTAPTLLEKAAGHMRDRAATYDRPEGERSMGRTVAAFNAITGRDLKESEGWLLMQILKDVRDRQRERPHPDSLEDCIAYSALKAEARLAE